MTNLEALTLEQCIQVRLLKITHALDRALLENPNMAVSPAVAQIIAEFDTATDAIAARIAKLIAASTTLSADDTAALEAEVAKLQALGKDPENPVPPATV